MLWTIISLLILFPVVTFIINARLFAYIKMLEHSILEQIARSANLQITLKEIVHEGYLTDDGRLKKMNLQQDRNRVLNGIRLEDTEVEL